MRRSCESLDHEEKNRYILLVAWTRHWSRTMDIKDGTVEGFIEVLSVYARNLGALSELWVGLSTDNEEDDVPPQVWISDAKPVQKLSETLHECSTSLQVIWSTMPVDLRDIVNIKVRKVKQTEEHK